MAINYFSEEVKLPDIEYNKCSEWITKIVEIETLTLGDVSIIFCSDSYLLEMNREYLNHDYYTDIITFDYSDNQIISGDLFISLETVQFNSKEICVTFNNELLRVIIHGILHLIGYNDKSTEEQTTMRLKEDQCLIIYNALI
ncbi:MAG: rRNA maturation RNase YbeY [Bacteroidales bacterium]|nr:rRNA maturation RNase YbeY [Bacteroidales bacterium]